MIETIAAFDGRLAKIAGPARSGKTEALVARCATLLGAGTDPSAILVEVSSAFAAQAFRQRLKRAVPAELKEAVEAVTIARALDVCAETLAMPEALAATGRTPRLLNRAEYNFFLEDMKTLGLPQRRLRKMLSFFYEQWSKLVPESEWMGGEEKSVIDHAVRVLRLRGAMLPEEAPAICAAYLKSDEGASARQRYDYVLCDDFQNMGYAEQTCLCLLAAKQVIVAGNPNETVAVSTAHPYPEGFVQFDALRHGVEVFNLTTAHGNPDAVRLASALCAHGDMDPTLVAERTEGDQAELLTVKWNTPEDELNGLTKWMQATLRGDDILQSRTCVVVPNKRWGRMLERALRKRGFAVSASAALAGLGGDPRESARAKGLVAYTKLNLLAHPEDMTAWRSWCGFDNYLTNSDAWNGLQDFADEQGISLYAALERIADMDEEPFLRAGELAKRFTEGRAYIEKNAGRKGFTLMRVIGAEGLPEFEEAARMLEGDEDAVRLYELERACMTDPTFVEDVHALRISSYENLCGTEYDTVILVGAVDGFIPRRDAFEVVSTDEDRDRTMNAERRLFHNAVSKARERVVFSLFSKAELELAERTKMQVVRVKSENGKRMAILRPSSFLAEAGDACPSTMGGQSLLSEYGLN